MKLACLVHVVFLQHTRDFAPCRFSDAGGLRAWIVSHAGVRKTCTNSGPCGPARVAPGLYQRLAVAPESLREYDQFDLNGGAVQVPADASCASTRPDGMGQMRKCRRT